MADINNQYHFLDYAGLALFWSNVKKIIEDNELVTAVALTDLDTRVTALFNGESENSIIVAGSGEGSGVMKGAENSATGKNSLAIGQYNEVISENSIATGSNNIVGLKGWYYKRLGIYESGIIIIQLTKTQQIPVFSTSSPVGEVDETDIPFDLEEGDVISIVNDAKYDNLLVITTNRVSTSGYIYAKPISGDMPFDNIKTDEDLLNGIFDPEDYSIYCLSRPDAGMFDMGQDSFVSGYNSKATNGKSTAFGFNNHAYGKFSFVEGRDNEAGYAAHAEGGGTFAQGAGSHSEGGLTWAKSNYSHAEGYRSVASGPNSHAEGQLTRTGGEDADRPTGSPGTKSGQNAHAEGAVTFAQGAGSHAEGGNTWASGNYSHTEGWQTRTYKEANNSHAEGFYTETTSRAEHAEGEYNKSNLGTLHSVGIGKSDANRKNAHEIMQDGKHYIYGIGGYDGTNPDNAEDVASAIKNLIEITYADLVNLRNNSKLTSGRLYRIIDYITTTAQTNTQSAGHPFDVIVQALSESILSEQAWAIQSARDTDGYFANSKLSAWQIWYCLDNDTERFAWADPDGKGVIYRMIDEWNNDCPYDFKNIRFNRGVYAGGGIAPDGDEDMNFYLFTFSFRTEDNEIIDTSIFGNNGRLLNDEGQISGVYGNVIGQYMYYDYSIENPTKTTQRLNDIVFYSHYDYDGDIYYGCNSNIFNNGCYNNSFNNGCDNNSFGNNCYNNSFNNGCYNNSFGNNCYNNSFGNNCDNNSFGNYCSYNSFANVCLYNSFNNGCQSNSFNNNCAYNSFGNSCAYNSFGNYCSYNSFGHGCNFNSFRISGDNTSSLIGYCRYNSFDDGCSYNIIYSANTNSSNYLENYHINRGVKGTYGTPMLIDAQYLNAENVCNVYKKGDVAVVAYIQY